MPKIVYITHDGSKHIVDADEGNSVMQTAVEQFVPGIVGECGGVCSCATCHGYVAPAWIDRLPPKGADEESILDGVMRTQANSRLTCQIRVTPELDGLVVHLPASQF